MEELMMLPIKLLDFNDISSNAKVLYLHILKFAYNQVTCYPSIDTLAECMECSGKTLSRYLDELKIYGLIKYVRGYNGLSNQYVIVPFEWVTGNRVSADEYCLTQREFEDYADKVKNFYIEQGREMTTKRGGRGKKKTLGETGKMTRNRRIKELKEKLSTEGHELCHSDYAYYFVFRVQEIRGEIVDVDVREYQYCAEMFLNTNLGEELSLKIIDVYIETYKEFYENVNYKTPLLGQLRQGFVFNRIKEIAERELRDTRRSNALIVEMEF